MLRAASRRNHVALTTGRLDVRKGSANDLPWPDGTFDGAMALNNLYFWNPRQESLRELLRVLNLGARVVVGFHELAIRGALREKFTNLNDVGGSLGAELEGAGFRATGWWIERIATGRGLLMLLEKPLGPSHSSNPGLPPSRTSPPSSSTREAESST